MPVRAGNVIMGTWIFRKDRWMICPQTKGKCHERHAQGKHDCQCPMCVVTTRWPKGLHKSLQAHVPGGWSGAPD